MIKNYLDGIYPEGASDKMFDFAVGAVRIDKLVPEERQENIQVPESEGIERKEETRVF